MKSVRRPLLAARTNQLAIFPGSLTVQRPGLRSVANWTFRGDVPLPLDICNRRNGKFAGGAYNRIVRRLEKFSDESLSKAISVHEKHAGMLMELDARVAEVARIGVNALRAVAQMLNPCVMMMS